ncbi:elongation factor P, partial [Candidatus Pacearchaeota archaeon]
MPDIHKGMGVKWKGEYYIIIDFKHTHMGRGGANIRIKMKNLRTGRVINQNFKDTDELEEVRLERVPATFSYSTGDTYVFYNNETYEEIHFTKERLGDDIYYLKEGLE